MIDYEEIERYCKGKMNAQESGAFENDMADNSDLRNEVKLYKESVVLLETHYQTKAEREALRESLKSVGKGFFEAEQGREVSFFRKALPWAAAIAAVVIAAVLFFKPEADLYRKYAQHTSFDIQQKGSDQDESLRLGAEAFNKENYVAARDELQNYLDKFPNDVEAKFYQGIALLELGENDKALESFQSSLMRESVFKDKAKWYSVLSHIKTDDFEQAKLELMQISKSSSYYKQAQELKEALTD